MVCFSRFNNLIFLFPSLSLLPDSITLFSGGYMHTSLIWLICNTLTWKKRSQPVAIQISATGLQFWTAIFLRWHSNHPYDWVQDNQHRPNWPQEMFFRMNRMTFFYSSSSVPIKFLDHYKKGEGGLWDGGLLSSQNSNIANKPTFLSTHLCL